MNILKNTIYLIGLSLVFVSASYIAFAQDGDICEGKMGDVKMSLLSLSEFRDVNGTCWTVMDGKDFSGTPLSSYMTDLGGKLPDARGRFFRVIGSAGRLPGSLQEDHYKKHSHKVGKNIYAWNRSFKGDNDGPHTLVETGNKRTPLHSKGVTSVNGGAETRPKNIAIYAYVHTGE